MDVSQKYYTEKKISRNKIKHVVWLYLCEILESVKLTYSWQKPDRWSPQLGMQQRNAKEQQGFLRDESNATFIR